MARKTKLLATRFLLIAGWWAMHPPTASFAESFGIRPGLWEVEQVIEIPGAPQGSFKNQWQHCVKEEDAKQGPVFSDADRRGASKAHECRIENLRHPSRGHVTYDIVCSGNKDGRIKVDYRYTESTFEGTTQMASARGNFMNKMKGRYVGPCKK